MRNSTTFVCFDVETTGLAHQYCEIIEIGAVKVIDGEIAAEFSELAKPDCVITEFITSLTGISNADVANARSPKEVADSFQEFAKGFRLVGQNVGFDLSFLRKYRIYTPAGLTIDNIDLARILLPYLPSYNLDSLADFFSLVPDSRHRALPDARLTAGVFLKLLDMLWTAKPEFINGLFGIANKAGSELTEFLGAHLRDRVENPLTNLPDSPYSLGGISGKSDNIYGNFDLELLPEMEVCEAVSQDEVSLVLSDGGALSKFHDTFEERSGQVELSRKIAGAFNESEILLAEAGTGTGKSIAYLVPSIIWAEKNNGRVVVSTNTKNLQEQLFLQDIPLLGKVLDTPFRAVILKGRGNYICLNRWNRVTDSPDRYLSKEEKGLLLPVASWLNETLTGDISETGFFQLVAETGLLDKINSDSPTCVGSRCKYRDICYVNRVRKAAQRAHIIIVNHSLVFSDMIADGGVLGGYDRIIFDEAHNIEKVAMRFLGITLGFYTISKILNRLYSQSENPYGILAVLSQWAQEMIKLQPAFDGNRIVIENVCDKIQEIRASGKEMFDSMYRLVVEEAGKNRSGHDGKLRFYPGSRVFQKSHREITAFRSLMNGLISGIEKIILILSGVSSSHLNTREDYMTELGEVNIGLAQILEALEFLEEATGQNVFWFEYDDEGTFYSLRIRSAPLDIDKKLAHGLYEKMETVIMTSATLTVAGDFSYIRNRLGIDIDSRDRAVTFTAASPFNYPLQSAVMVPSFLPTPKEENYIATANQFIYSLATVLRRGMLVLFTSNGHLHQTYYDLRDNLTREGVTILAQGVDGSRSAILHRFKNEKPAVLLGTDSFWEGVDVPGNALELVVIVKLPFAVPSDPVIEAQMEEVEKAGKDPFRDFSVPEAAIKLRQGAGRLIRNRNDRGAVIILDVRVNRAFYGKTFRNSLPGTSMRGESPDTAILNLKKWFEQNNS